MPLVVCNKAETCDNEECRFLTPIPEIEMGNAHCQHVGGPVKIMAIPDKDIKDPNWAFVRKKHGF